jgi:hypothetical protein
MIRPLKRGGRTFLGQEQTFRGQEPIDGTHTAQRRCFKRRYRKFIRQDAKRMVAMECLMEEQGRRDDERELMEAYYAKLELTLIADTLQEMDRVEQSRGIAFSSIGEFLQWQAHEEWKEKQWELEYFAD